MKKADLIAGIALLSFEEVKDHAGANGRGRYKYARWSHSIRVWLDFEEDKANVPQHLMIDIYYSVIAEAFYSCSIDGVTRFKSRNPEKVWKWLQEQLYLQQENKGLRP